LRIFTSPSLFAMRIVSFVFGMVLLIAIYAIAYRLGGLRYAVLSVLVVSLSIPFFISSHLGRGDIIASTLGFTAVALYLNNQSSRFWPGLLSGLCVGLAFEIHPHSIILGFAIAALYPLHWGWSLFRKHHFWGFVIGGITSVIFYATLHIIPYPQTYREFTQLFFTSTHTPPLLTLDLRVIILAFRDASLSIYSKYPTLTPLILIAIVFLIKRSSEADKTLLGLGAVSTLAYTLLIRNKAPYYAILFTPTLDLMLAALLLAEINQPWRGVPKDYIRRALVWGFCGTSIVVSLMILRVNFYTDYQVTQGRINQVVRPGDSIMGIQTFWFGLRDHDYDSWEELVYYQRYMPGSTLEDALRDFAPDILILDKYLDGSSSVESDTFTYAQHLRLPPAEMQAFLKRYGQLVASIDGSVYSEIHVYRINWQ